MSEFVPKPDKKSRYRKIEVRLWTDEKFRQLSPIPPCAQGLWLYLLTGPHTNAIPGVFRCGRAAMAEELNWDLEAFDKAFLEAYQLGMVEADWKSKVVWIPNAIKFNKPESPNVVIGWATEWDLIPECDLKRKAYSAMKANIHGLSESFGNAFDKSILKPSPKPILKAMPNQEQEQEQEQEQLKSISQNTRENSKLENQDSELPPFKEPDSEQGDRRTTWKEFGLTELPENWLLEALEKIPNASKDLCESKFAAMVDYFINSRPFERASDWQAKFESWVRKEAKPATAAQTNKSSGADTTTTTAGLVPKKQRYYGISPEVFMRDLKPHESFEDAAKRIFLAQQEVGL